MSDMTAHRRDRPNRRPLHLNAARSAAGLLTLLILAVPVAVEARRDRSTVEVNYHPSVVGSGPSAQLEALDPHRTGLLGERSWILTIGELNASKSTRYANFEEWVAAEPNDPVARTIAGMLHSRLLSPGGRTGDRGR